MDCQQIDRILDNHEATSLTSAARYEIDAHLSGCKRCAEAWQAQEALLAETPAAARPGLYEAVASRAVVDSGTGIPAGSQSLRRFGPLVGLAAAASVALVLVFVLQGPADDIAPGDSAESSGAVADSGNRQPTANGSNVPGLMADTPVQAPGFPAYRVGIHYTALPDPVQTLSTDARVEVCEFFMLSCVHCFNLESSLRAWHESRADTVELVRVPAIWNELSRLHARAFYTAAALGQVDDMMPRFFAAFHEGGNALATRDALRRFFVSQGVSAEDFDTHFDSSPVRRNVALAVDLNRRYGINSTPTLTVDGRFVTDVGMAGGSYDALFGVLDALVEQVLDDEVCEDDPCLHQQRVEEFIGIGRAPTIR